MGSKNWAKCFEKLRPFTCRRDGDIVDGPRQKEEPTVQTTKVNYKISRPLEEVPHHHQVSSSFAHRRRPHDLDQQQRPRHSKSWRTESSHRALLFCRVLWLTQQCQ